MASGFIGHGDSALNPPAETECFSHAHAESAVAEFVAVVPNCSDQAALVGLLKTSSHLISATESPPVVALGIVKGALEGVGVHGGR